MVDVNAIGAGGGSIAWLDAGGGLRVGPQSAGSEPGPACYGRGGTGRDRDRRVDRARLHRSRPISPAARCALDPELACARDRGKIAGRSGMSVEQAALGIHRVVNAQMAEGIRLVSVRRGIDPRAFAWCRSAAAARCTRRRWRASSACAASSCRASRRAVRGRAARGAGRARGRERVRATARRRATPATCSAQCRRARRTVRGADARRRRCRGRRRAAATSPTSATSASRITSKSRSISTPATRSSALRATSARARPRLRPQRRGRRRSSSTCARCTGARNARSSSRRRDAPRHGDALKGTRRILSEGCGGFVDARRLRARRARARRRLRRAGDRRAGRHHDPGRARLARERRRRRQPDPAR